MASIQKVDGRPAPYRVFWRVEGTRKTRAFKTLQDARRWVARLEVDKDSTVAGTLALGALCDAWLAEKRATRSPATVAAYVSMCRSLCQHCGPIRCDRVTIAHIEAWRNARSVDRSAATVRHSIKCARSLFRWSCHRGYCRSNPADSVAVPRVRRVIPGWLDGEQTDKMLAHLASDPRWREMHLLALFAARAGLRSGEIRALQWADVDLAGNIIRVNESKSKDPRIVPMHAQIRSALAEWPRTDSPYVFPPIRHTASGHRPAQMGRCFNDWLHSHGYKLTLHGLRHSFASQLAALGASEVELRDVLGHVSQATTAIYTHSRDAAKRRHIDALGG